MRKKSIVFILTILAIVSFCSLSGVSEIEAAEKVEKVYLLYSVKIYSKPVHEGELVGDVDKETVLNVLEKDGEWLKIRTPKNKIGWVHKDVTNLRVKEKNAELEAKPTSFIKESLRLYKELKLKETIAELEAKVKPIPASNIKENLRIYRELLRLDPKNTKYKKKVAYYNSKLKEQLKEQKKYRERLKANFDLELLTWRWSSEYGYVTAEGQVRNNSGRKLERVQALVTWYDKNGDMITSEASLIEYDPILPEQKSPFKVMKRYNPAMKSATIEFKFMWGNRIPTYRRK